jgi:hypothetical protein
MSDDEAWREIVENYGDTPEFPESDPEPLPAAREYDEPLEAPVVSYLEDEERYIPPPPPPVPRPEPIRLVAWAGVLLSPLILTIALIIGWRLPGLVSVLVVAWFLGGFALLVWQLPKGPSDPWDDGARV